MEALSRRAMLVGATLAGAGLAVISNRAKAEGFQPKSTVAFQSEPKDGRACSQCRLFRSDPRGDGRAYCAVVAGPISPSSWCVLWDARESQAL